MEVRRYVEALEICQNMQNLAWRENGQGPRLTEMTFQQVKFKWDSFIGLCLDAGLLSKKKGGLRLEMKQLFSNVRTLFAACISSLVLSVYMFHSFLIGLFTVLLLSFKVLSKYFR